MRATVSIVVLSLTAFLSQFWQGHSSLAQSGGGGDQAAAPFVSLVPGTVYTYRESYFSGARGLVRLVVGEPMRVADLAPPVIPVRAFNAEGKQVQVSYYTSDPVTGITSYGADEPGCSFRYQPPVTSTGNLRKGETYRAVVRIIATDRDPDDDYGCVSTLDSSVETFVGWETVTVPAGTYRDCIKIVGRLESRELDDDGFVDEDVDPDHFTYTEHIDPGVGMARFEVRSVEAPRDGFVRELVSVNGPELPVRRTTIAGFKFEDVNGNGNWEAEQEFGIPNWRIQVTGPEDHEVVTDAEGRFSVSVSRPGIYTVMEEKRSAWRARRAARVQVVVLLTPGEQLDEIRFGNQRVTGGRFAGVRAIANGPKPADPASHSLWILYDTGIARLVGVTPGRVGAAPRRTESLAALQLRLPSGEPIDLAQGGSPPPGASVSLWILSDQGRVYRGVYTQPPARPAVLQWSGCAQGIVNPAGTVVQNIAAGPTPDTVWAVTSEFVWRLFAPEEGPRESCPAGNTIAESGGQGQRTERVLAVDRSGPDAAYWVLTRETKAGKLVHRVQTRDASRASEPAPPCPPPGCVLSNRITEPVGVAGSWDGKSYWLAQRDGTILLVRADGAVVTRFPAP